MKSKILYWLAKHGIVECKGIYVIADRWYIDDSEIDDDRIIYNYRVTGRQIPFMNKITVPLEHDSLYRQYVQKAVKKVGVEW